MMAYLWLSQPTRAAWIEIVDITWYEPNKRRSQPTRAAWIEIIWWNNDGAAIVSQPTRAAWIEMLSAGSSPGG